MVRLALGATNTNSLSNRPLVDFALPCSSAVFNLSSRLDLKANRYKGAPPAVRRPEPAPPAAFSGRHGRPGATGGGRRAASGSAVPGTSSWARRAGQAGFVGEAPGGEEFVQAALAELVGAGRQGGGLLQLPAGPAARFQLPRAALAAW